MSASTLQERHNNSDVANHVAQHVRNYATHEVDACHVQAGRKFDPSICTGNHSLGNNWELTCKTVHVKAYLRVEKTCNLNIRIGESHGMLVVKVSRVEEVKSILVLGLLLDFHTYPS